VLEHVADDCEAFRELIRITATDASLQLTVPKPTEIEETDDWGFPDPRQNLNYLHYGPDFKSRFLNACPGTEVLSVHSKDAITGANGIVYFRTWSTKTLDQIQTLLANRFRVERER